MTEVPRFYYEAVRELKDRGVEFLTLGMSDEIPSIVKVVLTTPEEKGVIDFPEVVWASDAREAVACAIRTLNGVASGFDNLVLGIDPGPRPGFAVLGDGKVIHVELLKAPEDTSEASRKALDTYKGKDARFRVGRGGGVYKERVLKILQENFELPIEVVDEKSTTPADAGSGSVKDIAAAINIALKQGRTLRQKIEVSPTEGEIKNIQRDSREISGNITISKALARRVAKGEITIDEAISMQQEK
jgi:hypothetical protein